MTRLASIVGVATVATLVLLSGCETAVRTDYADALVGTWQYGPVDATLLNPTGDMPPQFDVNRSVTVTIADGDDANTGSFTLMVNDAVKAPLNVGPLEAPFSTTVTGTINVDKSTITVTISATGIRPDPRVSADPAAAAALVSFLTGAPQELGYEVKNNDLIVSGAALDTLKVTTPESPKLTLTKSTN